MYMYNDVFYIGIKEFLDVVFKIVKNENIEYSFDVKKVVLIYKIDKEGKNSFKIVIDYDK